MPEFSTMPCGKVEVGTLHLEVEIDIFEFEARGGDVLGEVVDALLHCERCEGRDDSWRKYKDKNKRRSIESML